MSVEELIAEFSIIDSLPIDLTTIQSALRASGVTDEIYYFHDLELNPNSFAGFIHREEIPSPNGKYFMSTITYAKLGDEMERLVCCKEMLHIIDPEHLKVKTKKEVEFLISKIILPPEFVDPPNDGAHTNSDKVGLLYPFAILLPLAARAILLPSFKSGVLTAQRIAELAEIPDFAATLVMSDFWPRLHAMLVGTESVGEVLEPM